MPSLSDVLKSVREDLGLSQTAFAERLGCTHATISHREGGRQGVTSDGFEAIAQATGYTFQVGPDGWVAIPPVDPALAVRGQSFSTGFVEWLDEVDGFVLMEDDGLHPRIEKGDWVGFVEGREPQIGDVVVREYKRFPGMVDVRVWLGLTPDGGEEVVGSIHPGPMYVISAVGLTTLRGVAVGTWRAVPPPAEGSPTQPVMILR